MINFLINFFTKIAERYLPSAYVFSLILTLVVFLAGVIFLDQTPLAMIEYWGDGFWNLLTFSMQMSLILIAGFTLAKTSLVSSTLSKVAGLAKSNVSATLLVTIVSCLSCYLSWGFGLIVSALFAIEVAKKVQKVNFGLLIAASYSGFLVWHGGLSGSIPLKLTTPSDKIKLILGDSSIPLSETLFGHMNLMILGLTVATLIIVNYFFSLEKSKLLGSFVYENESLINKEIDIKLKDTFSSRLENSSILGIIIGGLGLIYVCLKLLQGSALSFNLMIFIFLFLGIILHKSAANYYIHFKNSVAQSAGIILQFPFYAGIMGMMSSSGMAQTLSEFFIFISTPDTFLVFTYISAGVVNFFVPSGGGQWAIQGPIILPAAKQMGISLSDAAMAIAWGDAWSNMVQPFWALPLLSIAKLELKDIMAYLVLIFMSIGVVTALCLYLI